MLNKVNTKTHPVMRLSFDQVGKPANQIMHKSWRALKGYKEKIKGLVADRIHEKKKVYRYASDVCVICLRTSNKVVDQDGLPLSFKYFVDALIDNKIIKDDNPDVCTMFFLQAKGKKKTEILIMKKDHFEDIKNEFIEFLQNELIYHNVVFL